METGPFTRPTISTCWGRFQSVVKGVRVWQQWPSVRLAGCDVARARRPAQGGRGGFKLIYGFFVSRPVRLVGEIMRRRVRKMICKFARTFFDRSFNGVGLVKWILGI